MVRFESLHTSWQGEDDADVGPWNYDFRESDGALNSSNPNDFERDEKKEIEAENYLLQARTNAGAGAAEAAVVGHKTAIDVSRPRSNVFAQAVGEPIAGMASALAASAVAAPQQHGWSASPALHSVPIVRCRSCNGICVSVGVAQCVSHIGSQSSFWTGRGCYSNRPSLGLSSRSGVFGVF